MIANTSPNTKLLSEQIQAQLKINKNQKTKLLLSSDSEQNKEDSSILKLSRSYKYMLNNINQTQISHNKVFSTSSNIYTNELYSTGLTSKGSISTVNFNLKTINTDDSLNSMFDKRNYMKYKIDDRRHENTEKIKIISKFDINSSGKQIQNQRYIQFNQLNDEKIKKEEI